jgi:hypothetical protein
MPSSVFLGTIDPWGNACAGEDDCAHISTFSYHHTSRMWTLNEIQASLCSALAQIYLMRLLGIRWQRLQSTLNR